MSAVYKWFKNFVRFCSCVLMDFIVLEESARGLSQFCWRTSSVIVIIFLCEQTFPFCCSDHREYLFPQYFETPLLPCMLFFKTLPLSVIDVSNRYRPKTVIFVCWGVRSHFIWTVLWSDYWQRRNSVEGVIINGKILI